ncbi:MAG: response regulator transcription factor [Anaerolineae bacterium]|nr:response regulator transcription factor [Anaerolineae bacterium]
MANKILVIDDDVGLLTLLKMGLEREGFAVTTAESGREGLRKAYETRPDAIILDIMMAEMDGWTTCQRLRHVCDTPIIMLTARSGGRDVVRGLSLGADDYISKPCSFDELKARIYTIMRRDGRGLPSAEPDVYDDGTLYVNLRTRTVRRDGAAIELTPTESRLLMYLVSRRGRIVPHRELLVNVWGPEYENEVKYLSVYIRYLRQKLEEDPSRPHYIRTRWKVGYFFLSDGSD